MNLIKKAKNLTNKVLNKVKKQYYKEKNKSEIEFLINRINEEHNKIILFPHVVDWEIPLFQRPQHIAKCMAEQGYMYLFFTGNTYDNIITYKEKEKNLFIVNQVYFKKICNAVKLQDKYIHLYSTDMKMTNTQVSHFIEKKYKVIYEYIDEISPELYGKKIPRRAWEKHERLIKDSQVYVVCTAKKLYEEVLKKREKINIDLITNGVSYEHFNKTYKQCPIEKLVRKNKPIIGYFGALANWFDYNLIEEVAKRKPNYEILLIGWEYDDSFSKSRLNEYDNITVLGPIEYKILPQYAQYFDISIIPFKINSITESTSPIKLFEYMALGKPIITTDIPECRLYQSVKVAKNYDQFIKYIEQSLEMKKEDLYYNILRKEALENTWTEKANSIIQMIK